MSKLTGKRFLITGANRGIGLEIIRQLFKHYNPEKVFAACRKPREANVLKEIAQNEKRLHIIKIGTTILNTLMHACC